MEEKKYFRIKDVAEFVDEVPSTLRYWEEEFKELKPKRGLKGTRLYTSQDIDTIRKIKFLLRTKGMHITAAKEQLKNNFKNITTRYTVLQELEDVRNDLKQLLSNLSKRK